MGPRLSKNLQSTFQPPYSRHHIGAEEFVADLRDGFAQQHTLAVDGDVAEALVFGRAGPVGRLRGGGKPALVDAAAMRAQRVQIAWI